VAASIGGRYHDIGTSRTIFALAGPGGAGKSVASAIFFHLISEMDHAFEFINVTPITCANTQKSGL
jgi:hypothetical protein